MFRGMEWSIAREFLRPVLSYDDLDYEAYDCWLCASPITKPLSIDGDPLPLSLIHISEPTRLGMISYAVFCLKTNVLLADHVRAKDRHRSRAVS